MKEFYMWDGEEYVDCTDALLSDLTDMCEDNENMIIAIRNYFNNITE